MIDSGLNDLGQCLTSVGKYLDLFIYYKSAFKSYFCIGHLCLRNNRKCIEVLTESLNVYIGIKVGTIAFLRKHSGWGDRLIVYGNLGLV